MRRRPRPASLPQVIGTALAILLAAAPAPVRAGGTPDADEKAIADGMRPFYARALERAGSKLKSGTPAWEASLAASASAMLAARPDDCPLAAWAALSCGIRSLSTPSQSMAPSLEAGDTFLAIAPSDGRPLRRGDVVAFRDTHAADPATATIYVSRLIGLPGERIRLSGGHVEIDGTRVPREPTGETVALDDGREPWPRFTERLPGGRAYDILRPALLSADSPLLPTQEDMPEMTVPPDRYFLLGDNRLNAMDSRFAARGEGPGLPAAADFVGRASLIIVSPDPSRIGRQP